MIMYAALCVLGYSVLAGSVLELFIKKCLEESLEQILLKLRAISGGQPPTLAGLGTNDKFIFPPNWFVILLNMADNVRSPAKKRRKTDRQDLDHEKGKNETEQHSAKRTGETNTLL